MKMPLSLFKIPTRLHKLLLAGCLLCGAAAWANAASYQVPSTNITLTYAVEGVPGSETITITDCNSDAEGGLEIPSPSFTIRQELRCPGPDFQGFEHKGLPHKL